MPFELNSTQTPTANLNTPNVQYIWTCSNGTLMNSQTATPNWNLPSTPGVYTVTLSVSNSSGTNSFTKNVLVKDFTTTSEPTPLVYYPFNGNTKNEAQNALHAVNVNAVSSIGANGETNGAYHFPSSASYIYTPNETALNFQNNIAVSFWVKPDVLPNNEQFIISHGSWEERYKISIIPERKVRWTVKTTNSIADVDADTVLEIGKYTHFTAIYTGYSLELYRNGVLSGFKSLTGNMMTTTKNLTIARKDASTVDYNFQGTVDEVRIYNAELSQKLIEVLPTVFNLKSGVNTLFQTNWKIFPNPFRTKLTFSLPPNEKSKQISIFNTLGSLVYSFSGETSSINPVNLATGIYYIRIETDRNNTYSSKVIKTQF